MARALRRHLFVMAPPGYRKRRSDAEQRRDWFCAFNVEATKRNAFIISTPGSPDVIVEVLPGSDWISELKERGFPIR